MRLVVKKKIYSIFCNFTKEYDLLDLINSNKTILRFIIYTNLATVHTSFIY